MIDEKEAIVEHMVVVLISRTEHLKFSAMDCKI